MSSKKKKKKRKSKKRRQKKVNFSITNKESHSTDDALKQFSEPSSENQTPGHMIEGVFKRVDYDENIFDRLRTHWLMGDWEELAKFDIDTLTEHSDRARLALLVAAGNLQTNNIDTAHKIIQLSRRWGVSELLISQILIAGVHNSLGQVALLLGNEIKGLDHFEKSISMGTLGSNVSLLSQARVANQLAQMGSLNIDDVKQAVRRSYFPDVIKHESSKESFPQYELFSRLTDIGERLFDETLTLDIDAELKFDVQDPFLPGKIALALAYLVTQHKPSDAVTVKRCNQFAVMSHQLINHQVDTWGIYFYLLALKMLQQSGLLEACVSDDDFRMLKKELDWRSFVYQSNYRLHKNKPNNYYGVAYGIASIRSYLGWDEDAHCQHLLGKMVDHYRKCSGRFGFADETNGAGRYDRYSFLLIAEIAHHLREAGKKLSAEMMEWLRRSCEVVLNNLNQSGDGFPYGRSIGAYGDTAYMEILSAAAWNGVLSLSEAKAAHAFCCKATKKFLNYWWDDKTSSVNLWREGRRTDKYRGKHRALGESLSLIHQHLYVHQIWNAQGFDVPISNAEFQAWIDQRPHYLLTHFSDSEYSYALMTIRDGKQRFNLPLVNGDSYHSDTPYYPIPFAQRLIQGVADEHFPQLTPRIQLVDGTLLMPLTWYKNISFTEKDHEAILSWEQPVLDELGEKYPQQNDCLSIETSYKFQPGCITRIDRLRPKQTLAVESIVIDFACFSTEPNINGLVVKYEQGEIYELSGNGFDEIETINIENDSYDTNEGSMSSLVRLIAKQRSLTSMIEHSLVIKYHN